MSASTRREMQPGRWPPSPRPFDHRDFSPDFSPAPCSEFSDESLSGPDEPRTNRPFWSDDGRIQKFHHAGLTLTYEAALVVPSGFKKRVDIDEELPLVIYFAGLCSHGGLRSVKISKFEDVACAPFVLVAPIREKGTWWFLDSEKEPYGFIEGKFLPTHVELFLMWIKRLAMEPTINANWISLCGYSAGAYAVTEIVAGSRCCVQLAAVLVGGLHGHSQPDCKDVKASLHKEALTKWDAYIRRIENHRLPPREFLCIHHPDDEVCPWDHAQDILEAMQARRTELEAQPVVVDLVVGKPKSKRNKLCHNYHDEVIFRRSFFAKLLPHGDKLFQTSNLCYEQGMYSSLEWSDSTEREESKPVKKPPVSEFSEIIRNSVKKALDPGCHTVVNDKRKFGRQESSPAQPEKTGKRCRTDAEEEPSSKRGHYSYVRGPQVELEARPPWRATSSRHEAHALGQKAAMSPVSKLNAHAAPAPKTQSGTQTQRTSVTLSAREEKHRRIPHADRPFLKCASPNCWFLVHPDPEFGGFCCRKCHWRTESGSKCKKKHGALCKQQEAPENAVRAEPIDPDSPLAV